MRRGRPPTVTRGPYTGDELSVDHIIPFAVMPQLDHVIANLELMPLRMNRSKGDKMGERQKSLMAKLRGAGLAGGCALGVPICFLLPDCESCTASGNF